MKPSVPAAAPSKQLAAPVWQVGPWGMAAYEERVVVAVGGDRYDVEVVAARFAFCPEAAARAAVKGDAAFGKALFVSLPVHVAEHQHPQGARVLYDGGDQSVGLLRGVERLEGFCCDFHGVYCLTLIFSRLNSRLSTGIGISL